MKQPPHGHHIALAEVPASAWKNGGGVTRELLAWPRAQDWVWRLSVAEVQSDGPFSHFDGVQRWFAVLAGAGVHLDVRDTAHALRRHTLTQRSAPFCFDGAADVDCQLLYGATQDFNLMVRPAHARAHMQRLRGEHAFTTAASGTLALYANSAPAQLQCAGSSLTVPAGTLYWQPMAAGTALRVLADDALLMEITPCP